MKRYEKPQHTQRRIKLQGALKRNKQQQRCERSTVNSNGGWSLEELVEVVLMRR